ncbi:gustatory and pheromone receptor 32a-like [Anopheles maculipalpis]|uniref:gustatory and pheromone receptor 32a-like n=1 Tax=Anopheles maculipalpis TaxID=1496333 RepID=UPI0021595628|nr:gustatory and pheromone receptor 32a-like [Anopheles maculipalpis]
MNWYKCSELFERYTWSLLLACGILPLQFNPGLPGQFSQSRKHVVVCIVKTFLFAFGTPGLMVAMYIYGYIRNFRLESILIVIQLCFIYLFMIMLNVVMLINADSLCGTLNALFELRNKAHQKWNCSDAQNVYGRLLSVKVVIIDAALLTFSWIMYYVSQNASPTTTQIAIGGCFILIRYIFTVLVNLYLIGMMIGSLVQGSINSELIRFGEQQAEEEMASVFLYHVYMLHCKIVDLEKQFMTVMNLPILLLNCWYFFTIVSSIYYMYTSTMIEIKNQSLGMEDIVKYLNSVTFFLFLCVQLYCTIIVPASYTERSKKMCSLLNTINQQYQSPRMERLLNLMTLDCMHREYGVRNYEMYEMDRALLFGIIATVTSYVIILVQFHMQEYG